MIAYRTTRPRGGFTLIELLVVVALIGILAALAAGTFVRIQAAENRRATAATLNKLHMHLDGKWKAVLDDAKKTVPPEVLALAGNDKDRATALWTYARLQNEFPDRFDEVWIAGAPGSVRVINLNGAVLTPKRALVDVASKTYNPPVKPEEESAALFYAAINSTSVGGVAAATDGLTQQTVTTQSGLTYYRDAWGTPISFKRWANVLELQSWPTLKSNPVRRSQMAIAAGQPATFDVKNPLDPTGKLLTWQTYSGQTDNPWGDPTNPLRRQCLALAPGTNPMGINLADFTNENFVPTLVSYGPNKARGQLPPLPPFLTTTSPPPTPAEKDDMDDNILSFRVRREGAQGD